VALIAVSLSGPSGGGPTFANYKDALFNDAVSRRAILTSLFLAIVAAIVTLALGSAIAWIDRRTRIPERRLLMGAAILPLGVPGIVFAVALSQFWGGFVPALAGTLLLLLLAYAGRYLPLATGAAGAALGRVDTSFEQSARLLGAPFAITMRDVSLPLMGPGLIAGGVLIFAAAMQDLGASILLVGADTITLPVAVYRLYEAGQFEAAAALAVVDLVIVGLAIWCAASFVRNPVVVPGGH
jgi:iron(III) transport system permease protein